MLSWSLNILKWAERNSREIILQNKSPALFMWVGYKRQSSNMFRQSWLSALTFMWDVCASWPCSVSGGELQGIYFSTGSKCTCEGRLMTEWGNRTYPGFKDVQWGCVWVISLLLSMMHCALFQLLRTLDYLRISWEWWLKLCVQVFLGWLMFDVEQSEAFLIFFKTLEELFPDLVWGFKDTHPQIVLLLTWVSRQGIGPHKYLLCSSFWTPILRTKAAWGTICLFLRVVNCLYLHLHVQNRN